MNRQARTRKKMILFAIIFYPAVYLAMKHSQTFGMVATCLGAAVMVLIMASVLRDRD